MRRCLLLAMALCCSAAQAGPQPHIDLSANPSWKGWSRPGRSTEVEIRVTSDMATRATLEVVAGRQSVRADLDLQPGRVARLHVPVGPADSLIVSAQPAAGPAQRLELGVAQSESPLLGVGLATNEHVALAGFQTVALGAAELPRHESAYSSIDALVLDEATLGALDPSQLGALLAYAASCGRIALVSVGDQLSGLLNGASGCGARSLLNANSAAEAGDRLTASLTSSLPSTLPFGAAGELMRPAPVVWSRVALALAAYFAAQVLVFLFVPSLPAVVLTPALAAALILVLLKAMQPQVSLLVWGEATSGARLAGYQAWQGFEGGFRERARVPIPPQLASGVRACQADPAMQFDYDVTGGRARFAEFDTRLFHRVSLCYSGSFPIARALVPDSRADGSYLVRNPGTHALPGGLWLSGGAVHALPALGPGASASIDAPDPSPRDAVVRTALTRLPAQGMAALWELDLAGVAQVPAGSRGWLLLSVPSP